MKKTILSILCFLCSLAGFGQSSGEGVVRQFGNNLRDWCSTKDTDYRDRAHKQCTDACRVKNKIMEDFAASSGFSLKDYVVPNYLNAFEDALDKGAVSVSIGSVRTISNVEQSYGGSFRSSFAKEAEKRSQNIVTVACELTVTGAMNYHIKDLYYIKKGKIVKITPYEEVVDQKTGKKKVLVDFSDLEDTSMLGFSINHDQHFQTGASMIVQLGWLMMSLDFGINLDSNKYLVEKMDFTDIMNYRYTQYEYDPKWFFTGTFGVYLKYISLGCGVGFASLGGQQNISERKAIITDSGDYGGYQGGSYSQDNHPTTLFMLRPQIRGHIPISSSFSMSIGVGYDFIPKMKALNGYNASIGFHFEYDDLGDLFSCW